MARIQDHQKKEDNKSKTYSPFYADLPPEYRPNDIEEEKDKPKEIGCLGFLLIIVGFFAVLAILQSILTKLGLGGLLPALFPGLV